MMKAVGSSTAAAPLTVEQAQQRVETAQQQVEAAQQALEAAQQELQEAEKAKATAEADAKLKAYQDFIGRLQLVVHRLTDEQLVILLTRLGKDASGLRLNLVAHATTALDELTERPGDDNYKKINGLRKYTPNWGV